MNHLTLSECKEIWVAGAIQRLFTLKYFNGHLPFWIEPNGIDDFIQIDEHRMFLFPDENEIKDVFYRLIKKSKQVLSLEIMELSTEILIAYKNDRENLVKFSLCHTCT